MLPNISETFLNLDDNSRLAKLFLRARELAPQALNLGLKRVALPSRAALLFVPRALPARHLAFTAPADDVGAVPTLST